MNIRRFTPDVPFSRSMKTKPILFLFLFLPVVIFAQETWFFSEGTNTSYYDQGLVDVANLGNSYFEITSPPGLPQYSDKVPCSTTAWKGNSSLKFNYSSAPGGNWKVRIFRTSWSTTDVSLLDTLAFYAFSTAEVPATALPLIGMVTLKTGGSAEISSKLYKLSDYNTGLQPGKWTRITFPLKVIMTDTGNSELNFTAAKAVIFNQSETNNTSRTLLLDEITAFRSLDVVPPVNGLTASGYDSHAELSWIPPAGNLPCRLYASFNNGQSFEFRGETTDNYYLDFIPPAGRNNTVKYRVVTVTGGKESEWRETNATIRDFSNDELLDMVEYYTFRYFWDGAHQPTGMAPERSNGSPTTVASGGTGMGLMALIAAHERQYKPREEIKDRVISILTFLENCQRHHGAWAHWYNATTAQVQPFSTDDDGGDLVETSYVAQALIALKNYFSGTDSKSLQIREKADQLWKGIDWDWYRQGGQQVLYWHWSPNVGFKMNMKVKGWNECLVTYLMAASSPTHPVPESVYTQGWTGNGSMVRKRTYYNNEINLSPDWGGPLFWIHYSHLGIDPRGLKDRWGDYWKEHVNTVKIHHAYSVANPGGFSGYSDKCWGLTASDDPYGYTAHQPMTNDNGTISPTAALASMPYAPEEALKALKYFYRERGKELFGRFGPYDAFNDQLGWVKKAYLAIDQGPVAVMIENFRTGLLWKNVMKDPDVQAGLQKLGFTRDTLSASKYLEDTGKVLVWPNPANDKFQINLADWKGEVNLTLYNAFGSILLNRHLDGLQNSVEIISCRELPEGIYFLHLASNTRTYCKQLIISH